MYYLPICLIFIGLSIITFIYIFKNRKEKIEKHLFANEILIASLFLLAGITFPFMYQFHSSDLPLDTLNYLWLFTSTILLIELAVLLLLVIYNFVISKRNPNVMADRDYNKFCEDFIKNWVYDFKKDLERKVLHLFTVFVIFIFWTLGTIFESIGVLAQWKPPLNGLDSYSFAYWFIIMIGLGFVMMFQVADLARLNAFYTLPNWAKSWYCKQMRKEELDTFITSASMVLCFIPFVFVPFPIFAAVALITTLADAAASIVGKKFGKHKLKKNSEKTIEGYIAGGSVTFLIVIIISWIYYPLMPVSTNKILFMAIIATIIFLLIDIFAKNISDNILNPILTGTGMWIILLI